MKKLLSTLALSLSAIVATSAMAGPHDQTRFDDRKAQPSHMQKQAYSQNQHKPPQPYQQAHKPMPPKAAPAYAQNNHVRPAPPKPQHQQLRVGQDLPKMFDSSRYKVSSKDAKNLAKTDRNHQWYKINGDYVLVNEKNNRIVKVFG